MGYGSRPWAAPSLTPEVSSFVLDVVEFEEPGQGESMTGQAANWATVFPLTTQQRSQIASTCRGTIS